jgi:hypothetical protein
MLTPILMGLIALACAACSRFFTLNDTFARQYDPTTAKWSEQPFSVIAMRDRWPVGVPLQIEVRLPGQFKHSTRWRKIVVTPEYPGALSAERSLHPNNVMIKQRLLSWSPGLAVVGTMPPGAHEVRFLVEAQEKDRDQLRSSGLPSGEWTTIKSTTLVRPVTQVPSIDDVVHPVTTAEIARLISHHLALEFDDARTELGWVFPPKALAYELRNIPSPPAQHDRDAVAGLSIALRIRFVEHGAEVAIARFFIASAGSYTGAPVEGDLDRLREGLANPDGWTVVVESDPEIALLDIENDRYWSGRFERPLSTVAIRPKPQPR